MLKEAWEKWRKDFTSETIEKLKKWYNSEFITKGLLVLIDSLSSYSDWKGVLWKTSLLGLQKQYVSTSETIEKLKKWYNSDFNTEGLLALISSLSSYSDLKVIFLKNKLFGV